MLHDTIGCPREVRTDTTWRGRKQRRQSEEVRTQSAPHKKEQKKRPNTKRRGTVACTLTSCLKAVMHEKGYDTEYI